MAKRHGVEFWRAHIEAWHRSDLTQVAYCECNGLSTKSLRRWLWREKRESAAGMSSLTLVPVSMGTPATSSVVKLRSPDGWEIEMPGSSVPLLIDFLKHLS